MKIRESMKLKFPYTQSNLTQQLILLFVVIVALPLLISYVVGSEQVQAEEAKRQLSQNRALLMGCQMHCNEIFTAAIEQLDSFNDKLLETIHSKQPLNQQVETLANFQIGQDVPDFWWVDNADALNHSEDLLIQTKLRFIRTLQSDTRPIAGVVMENKSVPPILLAVKPFFYQGQLLGYLGMDCSLTHWLHEIHRDHDDMASQPLLIVETSQAGKPYTGVDAFDDKSKQVIYDVLSDTDAAEVSATTTNGDESLLLLIKLTAPDGWRLESVFTGLSFPYTVSNDVTSVFQKAWWSQFIILLLVLAGIIPWFQLRVLKPLDALSLGFEQLRKGTYDVRLSASHWQDECGEIVNAFNHMAERIEQNDQVNRKRARELAELLHEVEKANQAKREFLANVSHEMRTPLNGIIGICEMLDDSPMDFKQQKLFATINHEADFLLQQINDILDFSKIEAGKVELESVPFSIRTLGDHMIDKFSLVAREKALEFSFCVDADIPDQLQGDPVRFAQILVNLISNAIKFTEQGEIKVNIRRVTRNEQSALHLMVKDTGIGMSPDVQKQIFESFSQADSSMTRKYGGTGLGTTICKQLVQMMDGDISVESEPGRGCTFHVTLPLVVSEQEPPREVLAEVLGHCKTLVISEPLESAEPFIHFFGYFGSQIETLPIDALVHKNTEVQHLIEEAQIIVLHIDQNNELMKPLFKHLFNAIENSRATLLTNREFKDSLPAFAENCLVYEKPLSWGHLKEVVGVAFGAEFTEGTTTYSGSGYEDILKGKRILVAEDYPTNQEVVSYFLRSFGCEYELVDNGLAAVNRFQNKVFDAILMDMQMPIMDGAQATREIRDLEHPMAAQIPIIGLTAHAIVDYRDVALKNGMTDYLTKPIRRRVLERALIRCFKDINEPEPLAITAENSVLMQETKELPLNFSAALDEFGGDEPFFQMVLDGFLDHLIEDEKQMNGFLEAGHWEELAKVAHKIKGGASNLRAEPLALAAKKLELAAKTADQEQVMVAHKAFSDQLKEFRHYLSN